MTLTPTHIAKMQEGRKRRQNLKAEEAIARVQAFTAWLKAGSPSPVTFTVLPTDEDYAVARSRGAI